MFLAKPAWLHFVKWHAARFFWAQLDPTALIQRDRVTCAEKQTRLERRVSFSERWRSPLTLLTEPIAQRWRFARPLQIFLVRLLFTGRGHTGLRLKTKATDLDGQALATFAAASVNDGATTTCFHANAKPMGAFATGDGRLISTFHFE